MPFKSSLARSAGKLFGVFNEVDLSLRGDTQSLRIDDVYYTVAGPGGTQTYNAGVEVATFTDVGEYTITIGTNSFTTKVHLVGAGGGRGNPGSAGKGGYTRSAVSFKANTSYIMRVGGAGGPVNGGTYGGGSRTSGAGGGGGGYTGLFVGPVTHSNAILMAGGGGGAGTGPNNGAGVGGGSGGGLDGGAPGQSWPGGPSPTLGGTQTEGASPPQGGDGSALQGGSLLAGGGGGYYGGGGGNNQGGRSTGGGGGSGYIAGHPTITLIDAQTFNGGGDATPGVAYPSDFVPQGLSTRGIGASPSVSSAPGGFEIDVVFA